jgi:hypothetical protein
LHGNQKAYAKGIFEIFNEMDAQGNLWISRLNAGIRFDVRRYGNNSTIATVKASRTAILGAYANNRAASFGETTVYNYYKNTSRFSFTAPVAGYYRLDFVNPSHRSWYKNFSTSEIYLNENQVYIFELEYLHNNISTSQLIIENGDLRFSLVNSGTAYTVSGFANIANVEIPSNYRGLPVVGIAANAFEGSGLESVSIPSTVTSIGSSAFAHNYGLRNISFASGSQLAVIGNNAFYGCMSLSGIAIPNSVTKIGTAAFAHCYELSSVTLPSNSQFTTIEENTFYWIWQVAL